MRRRLHSSHIAVDEPQSAERCCSRPFLTFQPSLFQSGGNVGVGLQSQSLACSVADLRQSDLLLFVTNAIPVRPLRSTGVARLPRYYAPVRLPTPTPTVMSSRKGLRPSPSQRRVSQVPWSIFPHAPSSSTPASPADSLARCSSADGRLRLLWQVGRLAISVTRPIQIRFRYGSCVRSAGLRRAGYPTRRPLRYLLNEQFTE